MNSKATPIATPTPRTIAPIPAALARSLLNCSGGEREAMTGRT
jgi:hypothetical protein